jgi:glycerate dehydrogenase
MKQVTALFLDKASLYPEDLDFSLLADVADWQWFDNANPDDIGVSLEQAEIIVTNKKLLDSDALKLCKNLKLICVAATGVNNVDVEAASGRGVKVCNVRAYATASVAQHVFSLILSLNRHLSSYSDSFTNGDWTHSDYFCHFGLPISDLENKTLGIVGYGELGRSVAEIAKSFGMQVLIAKRDENDTRENRVDLSFLLKTSDVVSLHCPLTADNYHMIGVDELAMMKSDAIIINTARGGLINESALLSALEAKAIAGAGLDVLEEEPPSADHALLNYYERNLIVTPHIAWASRESRQRLIDEVAKNIEAFKHGQARNII